MEDSIDKRRLSEEALYVTVDKGLVARRGKLEKQIKVRMSKAEYTFLQFHHIIWKWALANHNLTRTELNTLLYIHPIITFTIAQFKEAQKEMGATGDQVFFKLKKNGWLLQWSKVGRTHYYTLSAKANTLISRLHKMYMLEETIPMSSRRNVIARSKKKKDVELMNLFKKFNNKVNKE